MVTIKQDTLCVEGGGRYDLHKFLLHPDTPRDIHCIYVYTRKRYRTPGTDSAEFVREWVANEFNRLAHDNHRDTTDYSVYIDYGTLERLSKHCKVYYYHQRICFTLTYGEYRDEIRKLYKLLTKSMI